MNPWWCRYTGVCVRSSRKPCRKATLEGPSPQYLRSSPNSLILILNQYVAWTGINNFESSIWFLKVNIKPCYYCGERWWKLVLRKCRHLRMLNNPAHASGLSFLGSVACQKYHRSRWKTLHCLKNTYIENSTGMFHVPKRNATKTISPRRLNTALGFPDTFVQSSRKHQSLGHPPTPPHPQLLTRIFLSTSARRFLLEE